MSHRNPVCYRVDPVRPDPAALAVAVRELVAGQLIAYPTDTVYGLGADPRQLAALESLFRAKGRAPEASLPLVAASAEQVEAHVGRLTPLGRRLADAFWPGPLTLVIAADPSLHDRLLGGRESVAVRVPDHAIARGLAAGLGYPVTATSANRSGEPAARTVAELIEALGSTLALVIDGGASQGSQGSTMVDVRTSTPILLRAGMVPWERVLQSLA